MVAYPDVPLALGVPTLFRDPNAAPSVIDLLTSDTVSFGSSSAPQWGIFLNGAPIIQADNVVSFTYKQEWVIADYPVEQGGFESYDKVQRPFDVRVRYSAGGDTANREALLASVAAIAGDLNFYDVQTPETTYSSANVTHYDYSRTNTNGVGLIIIDVWLVEVRQTGSATAGATGSTPQVTNPQDPSATSPVSGGQVQPTDVTSQQTTLGGATGSW
jgi:hypothetical protein